MYTNPSAARVLECVRESLENDIAPELQSDTAKVALQMILQMVQSVERRVPFEQQWMADECGRMALTLQEIGAALESTPGEAAHELRLLAQQSASAPSFPEIPAFDELSAAYRDLSEQITAAIGHLHDLAAEGVDSAPALLSRARAYIQLRIDRDMAGLFAMEAGMVGRG